jgi:hypothetical protein
LEEAKIWEHVEKEIITPIYQKLLKKETKAKIIISYLVKYHLITHIVENMTDNLMYEAFVVLYQSLSVFRHILSGKKISTVCMSNIDMVVSYLDKVIELRY